MEQIHGHEVLHMMEGHSYTENSLKEAIKERFGEERLFYTCSADHLTIDELVVFLKERKKFIPAESGFTVDSSKICNH
ncbi:YecH family metal-binding protein [Parabacteroides sp. Marseille-P3160]|uniref:YecH family metal-binding protein n=1 Tax=Parabacteroides sp. Marseille-P3160 TaxID=1917887 RepID=UPI0009B95010|nr:YecH family metal-binding protein [Parabacteroides sp. Marseille-P3160]